MNKITRTIATTNVDVLCMNLVTKEPVEKQLHIVGTFKTDKKLEKVVAEAANTDNEKFVAITGVNITEDLYAVSEEDFMKIAHKIDKK